MADLTILDREMYSEAEAARLLGVPQGTLHYWLEGKHARGKTYNPVIRFVPKGGAVPVTWAEFVEAGVLREYRRKLHVPMAELRQFIDTLREKFDVPYPLADRRPFASGKQLVWDAQVAAGLDPDFWLVAFANEQLLLTAPSESFLQRVEWDGDIAAGWRPASDPRSPVVMQPTMRFGRPSVAGISTEALWEHVEAGEDVAEVAVAFGVTVKEVRWALAYENAARAA
jgi:uncharacterized protein (DUF433 family)